MSSWIPLIKTAIPYVVQVLSIAIPAFTSRSSQKEAADIVPEQITELQEAATQNSESIKVLAEQLKGTLEGVDSAAIKLQQELRYTRRLSVFAVIISVLTAVLIVVM